MFKGEIPGSLLFNYKGRMWTLPRSPSADEWIMKMRHTFIYTEGFYSAVEKKGHSTPQWGCNAQAEIALAQTISITYEEQKTGHHEQTQLNVRYRTK